MNGSIESIPLRFPSAIAAQLLICTSSSFKHEIRELIDSLLPDLINNLTAALLVFQFELFNDSSANVTILSPIL